MRITTQMMTNNIAGNLYRQAEQILQSQKTVATGNRIHRLSDDPLGMAKVLDYRRSLSNIEQYRENAALGKMRLELGETVLDTGSTLLHELVNLATDACTASPETRRVYAEQVRGLHGQLVQLANTRMGDNYIFSGHQTDTPPYAHHLEISAGSADALSFGLAADAAETTVQIRNAAGVLVRTLTLGDGSTAGSGGSAGENTVAWDGLDDGGAALPDGVYTFGLAAVDGAIRVADYATYNGDAGDHRLVMGDRLGLVIHADGERIFGDLFQVLGRLEQALEDPDQIAGGNVIQSLIGPLHDAADRLEHTRAEGAVKFKHLQLTEDHYAGLKLKVEEMLYDTEKADMATAIVELQQLQSAYETTLATAARILQPSLINFLK